MGKDKRSNSCVSELASSSSGNFRRPSRAFLIKQRDSGEETLVTLTPVGNHRPQLPTIVGPKFSKGSMSSIESHSNDLPASQDALEAARVEKLVRNLRRQAASEEETRLQLFHALDFLIIY